MNTLPTPSISPDFWHGKRVFLTGHTGFKGAWLSLWLHALGARVTGYALDPPTSPSLFVDARLADLLDSHIADIRNAPLLAQTLAAAAPEIVIHMAAQPLVRVSYLEPALTYETNVMGTVYLLDAVRQCPSVRAVVIVTTDKCYENHEWHWGYREIDTLGGHDPYSSSKACAELVVNAYRNSFFNPNTPGAHPAGLASARAGNVIGGGDWALDRIVPDCIRAFLAGSPVRVRNPHAIRPWQHVLEPLSGYLLLAQRLYEHPRQFSQAFNFGPHDRDAWSVHQLVQYLCAKWPGASMTIDPGPHPHEAHFLKLDCSKAHALLNWQPRWPLPRALDSILEWLETYRSRGDIRACILSQIRAFEASSPHA
ncbi:MAG: CDP-glucose 4,6-dehydratase [bacterium]|nr:CDP-glucose 4,6-dehydratase [bacterium]